ncbi:hypothetical protein IJS77_02005 [bacterium]|nr:hypothetical protein [bacterium]
MLDELTTPFGLTFLYGASAASSAAGAAAKEGIKSGAASLMAKGYVTAAKAVSAAPAAASAGMMVGGGAVAAYGAGQVITAENEEELKKGTGKVVGGLGVAAVGAAIAPGAVDIAKAGGIPVKEGASAVSQVFSIPVKAATTANSEIQANALTQATGIIQPGSTVLKEGLYEAQAQSPARQAYKFDPSGTPEQVLAKNPHVQYDATTGKYYVKASWGENVYIDNPDNYMIVTYGEGDYNAVEGLEFARTYVEPGAYNATGAKNFIDPSTLKPGEVVQATKATPARFKFMPEGTKYMSQEGVATLQKDSVLMVDTKGRPYQNTIKFLVENNTGFTPEARAALVPSLQNADAETVALAIKKGIISEAEYVLTPENYLKFMSSVDIGRLSPAENARLELIAKERLSIDTLLDDKSAAVLGRQNHVPANFTGVNFRSYYYGEYDHNEYYLNGRFIKSHANIHGEETTRYPGLREEIKGWE